ncbi:hypothetical protein EDB85DRAFT_2278409 [Lactarius pseudohatsudake]|nr:hypothetical protein EDB85DRAFT_2278409 [Lactarius pseudohatsudake]
MAPSYRTPQPVSSGGFSLAENPASTVATLASTYLSGGPVRSVALPSEHHSQSPSPSSRTAPSSLPPPDVPLSHRHSSAYPPASQPVRVPDRPHPAIPTPGPGYYESPMRRYPPDLPPSRVRRSVAMPSTRHPNNARVYYDLGYKRGGDKDKDDHDTLEMHRSGALAEDPSNRPVFELWGSSIAGIQIKAHGNRHLEPQNATSPCRLPECAYLITVAVAARLGGFCSDSHMWTAINWGIATLCPRCKGRACPEGRALCSVCS